MAKKKVSQTQPQPNGGDVNASGGTRSEAATGTPEIATVGGAQHPPENTAQTPDPTGEVPAPTCDPTAYVAEPVAPPAQTAPAQRNCFQCDELLPPDWPADYCANCRPVNPNNPTNQKPPSGKPVIHTFFNPIGGPQHEGELRLLLKFISWWEARGWEVRVLNQRHAEAHPLFAEYLRKVETMPTRNSRGYETACWLRWLAYEQEFALTIADYDVFCRDRLPDGMQTSRLIAGFCVDPTQFTIYERGVPCLATGSPRAIRQFIDFILSKPDGYAPAESPDHCSDMMLAREFPALVTKELCWEVGDKDWLTAPFVHISHACSERLRPRYAHVDEIMARKS